MGDKSRGSLISCRSAEQPGQSYRKLDWFVGEYT
jgi:hypothetical protein